MAAPPELPVLPAGVAGAEAAVAGGGVGVGVGGTTAGALTDMRSATGGLRTFFRGVAAGVVVEALVDEVDCELLDLLF